MFERMVKSASEEDQIDYKKLLTQCGTAVVSHPLTQCRVGNDHIFYCNFEQFLVRSSSKSLQVLIQLGHEPVDPIYRAPKFGVSEGYYYKGFVTGYIKDAKLFDSKEAALCGLVYKLLETSSSSLTQVYNFSQSQLCSLDHNQLVIFSERK